MDKGGLYACGAQLRFEGNQGRGDDTAANGLQLTYCGLKNWYTQESRLIWGVNWGSWTAMKMCSEGKYIGAASVRFEDPIDEDDTALNGLQIYCVEKNWSKGKVVMVYAGIWGVWQPWAYKVHKLVKGAKVRFEDSQGDGDDTALNGIYFNVERPNFSVSRLAIKGSWLFLTSGHQGQFKYEVTERTSSTDGVQVSKEEAYGLEASISAGFEMISASVTASQSIKFARTVSSSLTQFEQVKITHSCPPKDSPTGIYNMWQFVMEQPADSNGIGFESNFMIIRCTPERNNPPQCPAGSCKDLFCQECS